MRRAVCLFVFASVSLKAAPFELPPAEAILEGDAGVRQHPVFLVRDFAVVGSRQYTPSTFDELLAPLKGRPITPDLLEQARTMILQLYRKGGYANTNVAIPDQDVSAGDIRLEIQEGHLARVVYAEKSRARPFHSSYLQRYFHGETSRPLRMDQLRDALERLQRHNSVGRIHAELKPDQEEGGHFLELNMEEKNAWRWGTEIHNRRSTSAGSEQIELFAGTSNFSGRNDHLLFRYGLLDQGFSSDSQWSHDNFSFVYSLPLPHPRWRVGFGYLSSGFAIFEEPFRALDITADSHRFRAELDWTLHEKLTSRFVLGLAFDWYESQTEVLGQPFSITPGAERGSIDLGLAHFRQSWVRRSRQSALALESVFSFGLEGTDNGSARDSDFVAWRFGGDYVRRLSENGHMLRISGAVQAASGPLLAPEQFSSGGRYSVRGYRETQLLRDQGYQFSVEGIIPFVVDQNDRSLLTLVPFIDLGGAGNRSSSGEHVDNSWEHLASMGLGLRMTPWNWLSVDLDWGYRLHNVGRSGNSLQDKGIHFRILSGKTW